MPTTVETPIFSVIVHKNQLKLMGLIHAMQSNGPLPQVILFAYVMVTYCATKKTCVFMELCKWLEIFPKSNSHLGYFQ